MPFLIGLIAGVYFINITLLSVKLEFFPGDYGDARFCMYLLEHFHLYMTGSVDSFWDAPFLYPETNVITYSENLVGSGIFYSLPRLFGCSRETSFQLWFILMSVLNYACCYLFLKELFKNNYAAVCGALIFAFSIALQSQMTHAQTFPRYAIPLAFWMGLLFLEDLKPKYFFGLLFFVVYQFYCCIYLGFMLLVPVSIFVMLSFFFKWKMYALNIRQIKWWVSVLAGVLVNTGLLLLIMFPYMERSKQLGYYDYDQVLQTLPTLRSFFYSHSGSFFWEFLNATGFKYEAFWDHQIFPGGVAVVSMLIVSLAVLYYLLRKKEVSRMQVDPTLVLLYLTGALTFVLYLRFQGFSLYAWLYQLPGFGSMRSLQRIINVELLFYAMATGFVFSRLFRKEHKYSFAAFVLALTFILLDNYIKHDYTDRGENKIALERLNPLVSEIKKMPAGSVISYEPDSIIGSAIFYQLDAMLAAQQSGLKTLNGYTSNSPEGYSNYWNTPSEKNRMEWLQHKRIPTEKITVVH